MNLHRCSTLGSILGAHLGHFWRNLGAPHPTGCPEHRDSPKALAENHRLKIAFSDGTE